MSTAAAGVWDTVLEFGQYQHATVDGQPTLTVYDASTMKALLDDFARYPDHDIFYDKKHEVVEGLGEAVIDRDAAKSYGDGHALAWGSALAMVIGGQVVRYERHADAPEQPPTIAEIEAGIHKPVEDGVYVYRSRVTPRGADPKDGLASFGYTSPYIVPEKDGFRLLNLTATNDPRMRGARLAYMRQGGVRIAMERQAMGHVDVAQQKERAWYAEQSENRLHTLMTGAWTANDRDGFIRARDELRRRKGQPPLGDTWQAMENKMDDKELMTRMGMEEGMSEAAKMEAACQYIRKMEEDAATAKKDKEEAMARAAKMEEEREEMRRKMEAEPFKGKETPAEEKAEKEAMQAMERRLLAGLGLPDSAAAAKAKLQAMERAADQVPTLQREVEAIKSARAEADRLAMERGGEVWADAALRAGRWDPSHAGGDDKEQDPAKRITMTRTFLRDHFVTSGGDTSKADRLLLKPGTFQPDERQVMSRLTDGGRSLGAPDPQDVSLDEKVDRAIAAEVKQAKAGGSPISTAVAMQRAKDRNPGLFAEYARGGTLAR